MFDVVKILTYLRKQFKLRDVVIILGIVALYFLTRVINLTKLPIFTDEAIYIHWAKLAWRDAAWRFVSLTDGKQPLHTWGMIPMLKLFNDPLVGGRMFSVLTGLFGMTGLMAFLQYVWGKRAMYIGALLFIFTPYYLFFDRMALIDSAVTAFALWFLFFSVLLINYLRLDLAILFGLLAGMGTLAKSSVRLFFIPLAVLPFLYFLGDKKNRIIKAITFYLLLGISVALTLVTYNVQRLSPFLHIVEEKNRTFVLTLGEFLQKPLEVLPHNIRAIPMYIGQNIGWVLFIGGILGLLMLWKKNRQLSAYLILWFLIQYGIIASFAKVLSSRYVIFLSLPFLIGFVYLLETTLIHRNIKKFVTLIGLFVISVAYFNYSIWFNPTVAPLPQVDRGQYIEDWPSGWGMREMTTYFQNESREKEIYVFTEGTFGLLPYALDIYFTYDPQYKIHFDAIWPLRPKEDFGRAQELAKKYPVYFVFHEREKYEVEWPLELVKKYPRPNNRSYTYLFRVKK